MINHPFIISSLLANLAIPGNQNGDSEITWAMLHGALPFPALQRGTRLQVGSAGGQQAGGESVLLDATERPRHPVDGVVGQGNRLVPGGAPRDQSEVLVDLLRGLHLDTARPVPIVETDPAPFVDRDLRVDRLRSRFRSVARALCVLLALLPCRG